MDFSDLLARGSVWSPTRELAEEAAAQLRAVGGTRVVTTSPGYRELDVENRRATWHMENWYRPIRAWYEDTATDVRYQTETGPDAMVLEVGLLNYEWNTANLSIQVMLRLVDAETGQLIGRTRRWKVQKVGRATDVLTPDNARLKTEFTQITRPLVAEALKDLGLTP